jgi:hypothetical protein
MKYDKIPKILIPLSYVFKECLVSPMLKWWIVSLSIIHLCLGYNLVFPKI